VHDGQASASRRIPKSFQKRGIAPEYRPERRRVTEQLTGSNILTPVVMIGNMIHKDILTATGHVMSRQGRRKAIVRIVYCTHLNS
jgi:hypothetical protein